MRHFKIRPGIPPGLYIRILYLMTKPLTITIFTLTMLFCAYQLYLSMGHVDTAKENVISSAQAE